MGGCLSTPGIRIGKSLGSERRILDNKMNADKIFSLTHQ